MKEDEYDLFISDPTDFMIRCYLPRVYGALAPLAKLPPIGNLFNGFEAITTVFATPEFAQLGRALAKAGRETEKFRQAMGDAQEELALLGFPAFSHPGAGAVGGAPFDTISSSLRGMKGSMLDMYRQPDKLLRACEMLLERRIARSSPADPKAGQSRSRMPFSEEIKPCPAHPKFYWPGLRNMATLIELGYVPCCSLRPIW
jgi:hypothetical protein